MRTALTSISTCSVVRCRGSLVPYRWATLGIACAKFVAVLPALKRYRKKFLKCEDRVLSRSGGVRVVRCCKKLTISDVVIRDSSPFSFFQSGIRESDRRCASYGRSFARSGRLAVKVGFIVTSQVCRPMAPLSARQDVTVIPARHNPEGGIGNYADIGIRPIGAGRLANSVGISPARSAPNPTRVRNWLRKWRARLSAPRSASSRPCVTPITSAHGLTTAGG